MLHSAFVCFYFCQLFIFILRPLICTIHFGRESFGPTVNVEKMNWCCHPVYNFLVLHILIVFFYIMLQPQKCEINVNIK